MCRQLLYLSFLVALVVAGCDDNMLNPSDIKEVTWKLEAIERAGSPTIQVPDPEVYTLILGNNGGITVRADCNRCTTTYTLSGDTVKIGHLDCTTNFCTLASLDGNYAAALEGDSTISISESHLLLRRGAVTLRFRN